MNSQHSQPDPQIDTTSARDEPDPSIPEPELPKPWNIEDPFQYSPPRPEGDHWNLLLEPHAKDDQILCDSLRDEVQNLLIFAGLFSAVVTAFTIESYKNLQQDPNDVMISLLANIAQRLDGPTNNSSSSPLPVQKPFSPSVSAIRVNNFWFISLVLSLTTVLVGIVSLQWLREHQSFPNLSTREHYAVSVMRSKAMNRWYVDKIFTAMPLLLQCALILFLGGLVDFIHGLGDKNVLIPVTIAVAFTLFFIVATTLLPSLQVLSLYFRSPHFGQAKGRADPPYPCPYKSPQSHAFRQLLRPLAILCDKLYPHIRSNIHVIWHRIKNPFSSTTIPPLEVDDFTRYLKPASISHNWTSFDLAWLAIRDGYSRRAFGKSSILELVGRSWNFNILYGGRDNEILPIVDILTGIVSQGYDKATSAIAYYAFCELSELTLLPLQRPQYNYLTAEDLFRQSAYLHDLLTGGVPSDQEATLTDVFDLDDLIFGHLRRDQATMHNIPAILIHHQNTSYYLRYHFMSDAPTLSAHRTELVIRLIRYFCLEHPETRDIIKNDNLRYPSCLYLTRFESFLGPDFQYAVDYNTVSLQVANVILLVLQQLPNNHEPDPRPNTFLHNLFTQSTLASFMDTASFFTHRSFKFAPPPIENKLDSAVRNSFNEIFSFFDERLNKEILSWSSVEGKPTLVFYLAAIYIQPLIGVLDPIPTFLALYLTVCKYKRRTIDMGITNGAAEKCLIGDPNAKYYFVMPYPAFTPQWWQGFHSPSPPSSSASRGRNSEPSIVMYYPFSTSENSIPES